MEKKTIAVGEYVAEIYFSRFPASINTYIVSRSGSPAVLAWGQQPTAEQAERAARMDIDRLSRRQAQTAQAG